MPTPSRAVCPSCRSDEHVTGRADPQTGDVQLSCGRCGRSWSRDGRRFATCGGEALTTRPRSGHDAGSLGDRAERTWGRGSRGAAGRHTLTALADHWSEQGWTTTDLAAAVRPQEDA
ncbi:hypothetical protein ACQE98_02315 [Ornithinimicrobium sp. W1679]|uniref:hypothetical protein n=1 Tax=Ornithinimicrobium sp. W1679 TaxID=3418770 RepID=UPI003CFB7C1C